jgi:hypothetical protein
VALPRHPNSFLSSAAARNDGTELALGYSNGSLYVFDVSRPAGFRPLKGHQETVTTLAFSQDGRRLASSDDTGKLFLWESGGGRCGPFRPLLDFAIKGLAFAQQGQMLAIGTEGLTAVGASGSVMLWDVEAGTILGFSDGDGRGARLTSSPDGKVVAIDDIDWIRIFDTDPESWMRRAQFVGNLAMRRAELQQHLGIEGVNRCSVTAVRSEQPPGWLPNVGRSATRRVGLERATTAR